MNIEQASDLAVTVGHKAGMSDRDILQVLADTAQRNKALLIGGYDVDVLIIATWVALAVEGLSFQTIDNRIDAVLQAAYVGIV
jgi:hypothetical protein